ncbi:receptor-type tyrosine-protein phosphatase kappa-like isoform X1 [Tubulanus polymorphus]|uniref:receptor-type tyrosine-protein phosphatase kappa-like isoform X1 n=1 Tax=Tubulanus polymorphus TaxID=672921 RepID=UPI003DA5FDE8
MFGRIHFLVLLVLLVNTVFTGGTSAKCFGKSCTGWLCHCSNTAVKVCPIKDQNEGGALTCPNPNTACESTIKTPHPWTPPGWTGPACQIGNVARGKTVTMSSTFGESTAIKCTDGRTVADSDTSSNELCHTNADQDAWIRIDLGTQYVVHEVTLWDRSGATGCDAEWKKRARNLEIRVGSLASNQKCAYQGPPLCGKHETLECSPGPVVGQYVTVQHKNISKAEYLNLAEIEVIGFKYIAPGDCSKGSNSFGCMIECYPCYTSESCNYLSGICESGCSQNYIGKWCESELKLFSNLTKSVLTDNSVKVSWTAYSGSVVDSGRGTVSVQYQVVHRKTSENTWTNQESAGVLTHHTITGLTPNTGYNIAVKLQKLVNSQLISTASLTSPILTIQTLCAGPLNGPKDVRVVSTAVEDSNTWPQTTNLILAWTALTAAELQCDVTKAVYQIQYKQLNGQKWTTTVAQPTGHTLTGLEPYTDYEIRVGVKNDVTQKFVYNKTINYKTATAAPGPVTSLTVSQQQTERALRVTWSAPDKPNGIITKYRLWYKLLKYKTCPTQAQGGEPKEVSPSPNTAVEHVFTGLKPHAEYEITVSAETSAGGLDSNKRAVTGTTLQSAPTGKPGVADVTVETIPNSKIKIDTYIDINFKDLACENQHGPVKHYRYKLLEKDTMNLVKDGTTPNKQFRIDKLVPFTEYELTYKWVNSKGSSNESLSKIFTTDEAVPGVPIPEARSAAPNSIIFAWSSPVPPLARITKYAFKCGNSTKNNSKIQQITTEDVEPNDVLTKTVSGLTPNKWYGCKVVALGKKGWGNWSEIVYFLTQVGIPGPPASLDFSFTRDTFKSTLTWASPNSPNGDITNYRLTCEPISTTSTTPLPDIKTVNKPTIEGSITTLDITTSLIPFTQYNCSVFASTSKGEGSPASVSFWSPGKITIPQLVVKKAAVTDTTVTLQITRVNTGNITGYEVIVKKHDGPINRRRKRAVNQSQYVSYGEAKQRGLSVYITAVLPPEVPSEFIVGDTRDYSGYLNAPLETGKSYSFILGIIENYNGETFRHYPSIEQQERIIVKTPSSNAGIIGGVVAVVVILILVAVVLVIIWRRGCFKRRNKQNNSPVPMNNIMQNNGASASQAPPPLPAAVNQGTVNQALAMDDENEYEVVVRDGTLISELLNHTLNKSANSWQEMTKEFESIPKTINGASVNAFLKANFHKNRFKNIMPYDSTRVVLEQIGDDPTSDYVNANYIRGSQGDETYIASQAPIPSTFIDHWRMIWQEKCPAIIVLTDLTEGQDNDKKVKCHLYWPTKLNTKGRYGDITVTVAKKMEKHTEPPTFVHFLSITKRGHKQAHNLIVFHYRGWPDHGVPFPASSVVRMQEFIKRRLTEQNQGPILIHCSAGAGRTGSYIATEYLLRQAQTTGRVGIFPLYRNLRQQRPEMIQNTKQYILVHQILLEELVLGPVAYPTTSFRESYEEIKAMRPVSRNVSDKIEEQFLIYKASTPIQGPATLAIAKLPINVKKTRYQEILPETKYQARISNEKESFINASFVHTITNDNVYIATQSPMPNTITDFWQMIFKYNCERIVMMHQEHPHDPTYANYWPTDGVMQFGPFEVSLEQSHTMPNEQVIYRDLILQTDNESRQIRQIQFLGWPEDESVPDVQSLFDFVQLVTKERVTSPIVVHCMDSTTRTGLFCAALELITKAPSSEEIDIYHCIQKLRMTRPQFIPNLEQYKFLHDLVILYFQGFETYANFVP